MAKLKLTAGREKKSAEDVPVVFSVFYGKPAQATPLLPKPLKNVLFDAKVNGEFFETARKGTEEPRGRLWEREILHLAATHNDKILELWGDRECVFCNVRRARAVVYQPLCCTYDGYYALAGGDRLFTLMLSLSKLVSGLDSHAKIRTAVGSSADVPYINGLAVPICSPDAECQKAANAGIGNLMRTLGKGLFDEKEFWVGDGEGETDDNNRNKNVKKNKKVASDAGVEGGDQQKSSSLTAGSKFATDMAMFREAVAADEWEEDDDVCVRCDDGMGDIYNIPPIQERIPLRYTAIIGEPSLMEVQKHISSQSTAAINNNYESFHKIAAFHGRFIMQTTEFRCAVCPTPIQASTLLHRPISFKREADTTSSSQPIRQTMLRLLQYTGGKWKYPETKAALGYDGIHHINDFIVPICHPSSACEETARRAAKKFIDQQLPAGAQVMYPSLSPDTDLAGKWSVENSGKKPKFVVEKVGCDVMSDTTDTDKAKAKTIKANDKAINIRRDEEEKLAKAAAALSL